VFPGTKRPDGTLRKERPIRKLPDGRWFVAQDEVAKFQNKGVQAQAARKANGPVGYSPPPPAAKPPSKDVSSKAAKKAEAKRQRWGLLMIPLDLFSVFTDVVNVLGTPLSQPSLGIETQWPTPLSPPPPVFAASFREAEERAAAAAVAAVSAAVPSSSSSGAADAVGGEEVDEKDVLTKKVKGLKKKLRAVHDLEAKLAKEKGEGAGAKPLNDDQAAKVAKKGELEAAVAEAEAALAALSV
jgi:hypothetical protein